MSDIPRKLIVPKNVTDAMRELLENEGLLFDEDERMLNFKERFWDPAKELE